MPVEIDTLVLGPLSTNTFVVRCDGECWVVDPAMDSETLLEFLQRGRIGPSRILLTHGHADHLAGVGLIKQAYPAVRLGISKMDEPMLADADLNMSAAFGMHITAPPADDFLQAKDVLTCGSSSWVVLDTSGHTPGGISFYSPDAAAVIVGDALFAGSIGRVDLRGGSAGRLLKNIRINLMSLPDETRVLTGHGEETTIGREKRSNPFMKCFYKP
jgi:hydroxyacylglutathione hydrolase